MPAPSGFSSNFRISRVGPFLSCEWDSVSDAEGYWVWRQKGYTWKAIAQVVGTRYDDWEISYNTNYTYTVRAYNSKGIGPYPPSSKYKTKTVGVWSNDIKIRLEVSFNFLKQPQLSWSPYAYTFNSIGTRGYDIFRRVSGNSATSTFLGNIEHMDHEKMSLTDTDASPNTTYEYVVVAVSNQFQKRFSSNVIKYTAPDSIPYPGISD